MSVFYVLFLICQFAVLIALLYFCKVTEAYQLFWPGQEGNYIWAIAIFEFLFFVGSQLIAFGDVKGLTVHVRLISVIFYCANIVLIALLFFKGRLTLNTFIAVRYVATLFLIVSLCYYLFRWNRWLFAKIDFRSFFRQEFIEESIKYYHNFCKPLVVLSVFGLAATYLERWFLQYLYGSVEQGYYSISLQLSSILLIFTTSIINIFWKEIAVTFEQRDMEKVRKLYRDIAFYLYGMCCLMAIFVFNHSRDIMVLLAGNEFADAAIVMMIMSLYPIHQTFGQLNGVFLIATGHTNLYKRIGIFGHISGLCLIYFLLAPSDYFIPGLKLASIGFAIRMVAVQLLFVNIQMYYICKVIEAPYPTFLGKQLHLLIYFCSVGLLSKGIVHSILTLCDVTNTIYALLLHGVTYLFASLALLYLYPFLSGFKKSDVVFIMEEARKIFASIKLVVARST